MNCSLIIPAYNSAKTLPLCLRSALNQSLPREQYEVIVIDDGSTDNTAEIAKAFGVDVIVQKNQGPAAARNAGAQKAKGDILVFTDSDCELDPNFLRNLTAPFQQPEITGAQGAYKTRQPEFMAHFGQIEIETRYELLARSSFIDFIGTYAAAYRREIFINNQGFDTQFRLASGEDTEFSYKLQKQGHRLVFCPDAIVYHQHPSSLGRYLRVKFYRGFWRVRLYSLHPEKMLRDSYTPQHLKIQVLTSALIPLLAFFSLINSIWLWCWVAWFLAYIYWSLPFFFRFRRNSFPGAYKIPFVLALRAIALGSGLMFGYLKRIF